MNDTALKSLQAFDWKAASIVGTAGLMALVLYLRSYFVPLDIYNLNQAHDTQTLTRIENGQREMAQDIKRLISGRNYHPPEDTHLTEKNHE